MSRPILFQTGPMMAMIEKQLRDSFEVHTIWNATDPEKLICDVGPNVRGIATSAFSNTGRELIDACPKLEIISSFGVGYNTVDAPHAASKNVIVTNTPDVLTEEVADTAWGLLLMTVRELSAAERHLRSEGWLQGPYPLTRGTLQNKRIGIAGLGRIGKAIARRAVASGLKISYFGRNKQSDLNWPFYNDLETMARNVDILLAVLPGGIATDKIIGQSVLQALGPDGILINVGRGTAVDEAALIHALKSGTIMSAGLDVFENEPKVPQSLMDLNNVVLLPHVGSASVHTRDAMGQLVVDNLRSWFESGQPLTPVAETPFDGEQNNAP